MKKNIHSPVFQITYFCTYCQQEFLTVSTSPENVRTGPCSNCHPFYTGVADSEVEVGEVEKYRQRQRVAQEKEKK